MGTQPFLPKKRVERPPPIFGPFLLWQIGWMDQDGTWHGGRREPRRLCVRWGHTHSAKRGRSPLPNFLPISIAANRETAAWIKMPLGTEVSLGPNDIVLDGDPVPSSSKRGQSLRSQFSAHVCVSKRGACDRVFV